MRQVPPGIVVCTHCTHCTRSYPQAEFQSEAGGLRRQCLSCRHAASEYQERHKSARKEEKNQRHSGEANDIDVLDSSSSSPLAEENHGTGESEPAAPTSVSRRIAISTDDSDPDVGADSTTDTDMIQSREIPPVSPDVENAEVRPQRQENPDQDGERSCRSSKSPSPYPSFFSRSNPSPSRSTPGIVWTATTTNSSGSENDTSSVRLTPTLNPPWST